MDQKMDQKKKQLAIVFAQKKKLKANGTTKQQQQNQDLEHEFFFRVDLGKSIEIEKKIY